MTQLREYKSWEDSNHDFHIRLTAVEIYRATFQWWVKFMGCSPEAQSRLRQSLYAAYPAAVAESRVPTASEITSTNIPYLDAVMEETLRVSHIVTFVTRETIADTQILGHHIPKGHQILFATTAEGFMKPEFSIEESRKVQDSPANNEKARSSHGVWNPNDVRDFHPERWLKRDENGGEEIFDTKAGPSLPFGAGPRGCFGRRLAYLEMRIAMTILIWEFEFLRLADEELASLECIDTSTETPVHCYVRLRKLGRP